MPSAQRSVGIRSKHRPFSLPSFIDAYTPTQCSAVYNNHFVLLPIRPFHFSKTPNAKQETWRAAEISKVHINHQSGPSGSLRSPPPSSAMLSITSDELNASSEPSHSKKVSFDSKTYSKTAAYQIHLHLLLPRRVFLIPRKCLIVG